MMRSLLLRPAVSVPVVWIALLGLAGCGSNSQTSQTSSTTGASATSGPTASTPSPTATISKTIAGGKSYTGKAVKPPKGWGNAQGRILFDGKGAPAIEVTLCEDFEFIGGCTGKTFRAKTDIDGNYTIDKVKPGDYALAVRVFDTNSVVYPTTGILSAAKYKIEADQTTDIRVTNLYKLNLQVASPQAGDTIKTGSLQFTWKAYPDAANYKLSVQSKGGGIDMASAETASTSATLDTPLLNGAYEWKVEASNAEGTKIAETDKATPFKVVGQVGSAEVTLVAPTNAAVVAGTNLKLTWKAHPLATSYQIYLKGVADSDALLAFEDVSGTEYAPKTPLKAGQYYWSINAMKDGKKVAASPLFSFKVK